MIHNSAPSATTGKTGWIDSQQVISGALHYFRVHPSAWADRLERLAAMGVTAVETYVPWNFHETTRGDVRFDGWRDLPRFITLAGQIGLDVIVRPSPYICAEWEAGGIPAWLQFDDPVTLRSSDPRFLEAVGAWYDQLLPVLTPLQADRGGPIVSMQIENEYGSYGSDTAYMQWSKQALIERGVTVPLFTSDGPTDLMVDAGTLPDVTTTLNFGSRAGEAMRFLEERRPGTPFFCGEYWAGWFDHWGEEHHTRTAESSAGPVRELLETGGSVNIYMAHGGTNFQLWSGANHADGIHQPTVTSYDSDAAIAEDGRLTEKFWAFRDLFHATTGRTPRPVPAEPTFLAPQSVPVTPGAALLPALRALTPDAVHSPAPLTMEQLRQNTGVTLYESDVVFPRGESTIRALDIADRGTVFIDGSPVGVLERNDPTRGIPVTGDGTAKRLSIAVESLGRINYGPELGERKGIRQGVLLDIGGPICLVHGWEQRPIDLQELPAPSPATLAAGTDAADAAHTESDPSGAGTASATVTIDSPADAHLALPGWGRGYCWLNGFLLGRYWKIGPQQTLYAPAGLWRAGDNEIVLLEMEHRGETLEVRDTPDLGPTAEYGTWE